MHVYFNTHAYTQTYYEYICSRNSIEGKRSISIYPEHGDKCEKVTPMNCNAKSSNVANMRSTAGLSVPVLTSARIRSGVQHQAAPVQFSKRNGITTDSCAHTTTRLEAITQHDVMPNESM
eukprot:8398-Heterococcus_DN1.PRE.2